jgi:hypothetical protein
LGHNKSVANKEKEMFTMGRDQYGQTYHNLGKHPRKELLNRLGRCHAEKMYFEDKEGNSKHVGYVIGRLWVTLYNVTPWEKKSA